MMALLARVTQPMLTDNAPPYNRLNAGAGNIALRAWKPTWDRKASGRTSWIDDRCCGGWRRWAGWPRSAGPGCLWRHTDAAGPARTPSQIEGPFYPWHKPDERDGDLLHRAGSGARAQGEALALGGRVLGTSGRPVGGAVVEIWQADNNGVYDHPRAPGRVSFDRAFQGYGAVRTDARGGYRFLTIVPVPYMGRPPHIHAKVTGPGGSILTTQLYLRGHPDNDRDLVLSVLSRSRRDALMMDLRPARTADGLQGRQARFDFVI